MHRRSRDRRSTGARLAVAIALVIAVFGFALPRIADYGEAWTAVTELSAAEGALLAAAGLFNLFTYWPLLVLTLPGLRWREAAVVNQASTAVANTVPAGGAVAVAVTYRMLRTWGFTSHAIANHIFVTGVWNTLVKLALPVVAVVAVASTGELDPSFVRLAASGAAFLALVSGGVAFLQRRESTTRRVGRGLDRAVGCVLAPMGHRHEPRIEAWLSRLRAQLLALIGVSGVGITAAAVVSHLSLYLVLLAALRATGVDGDHVTWAKVFAGFALVRLLSAIPITPGGVGVVELGYVGFLSAGAVEGLASRIAAGVLLFRAITYVTPIVLGAAAWLVFQAATGWHGRPGSRGRVSGEAAT